MSGSNQTKVDAGILILIIATLISLQAWTLKSVVDLKVQVASLNTKITDHIEQHIASK
jgi:CHASE1-domain containing sensor protein